MHPQIRRDLYIAALMLITVPLAGELKFYPVNETFRISFGAPTFFFFLLLFQRISSMLPGLLTGMTVVGFRIFFDFTSQEQFNWTLSLLEHYSSFFFYFSYSLLFYLLKIDRFHNRTILIGCIGMLIEVLADLVEFLSQYAIFHTLLSWDALQEMFIIALSHSFIVISFLNMIKLYEAQSREKQTRKQNEHMLMLISNLYEETIHLKKTLQNAESITIKSFELYQGLQTWKNEQNTALVEGFVRQSLIIAGEVHEIKKDNQRIFAGLLKLISDEGMTDYMDIHLLVDIMMRSNEKYARLLEKDIQFHSTIIGVHPPYHVFTLLSLMNNLVANAVEAIQMTGTLSIFVERQGEVVEIRIHDDGPGISLRRQKLIFTPGFTTKYDESGNPSTGIGLSYVKEVVEQLSGEILLRNETEANGTTFLIRLPIEQVREKE